MKTSVRVGFWAALALFSGCAAEETATPQGVSLGTGGESGSGGVAQVSGGAPDTSTGGLGNVATGGVPDTSTGGTSTGGTPAAGDTIDPVGVWWTELETKGWEELPWVGTLEGTDIRFVMRVEVTGTAPDHNVEFEFCALQTEWIDPVDPNNITTIGFRPDTVAAFTENLTINLGGYPVGAQVPIPSIVFRGGVDENDEEFDDDGDGNPAVTAWVKTLAGLQIEVFEEIKISATLDLSAADHDTLAGTVDFRADAMILSSNNPIIFPGTPVQIVPDSTAVPVTVKRLPGGGDCSSVPSTITFTEVPPAPDPLFPPADMMAPAPMTP